MELAELKYWERIWNDYEKDPATAVALLGIFRLLSNPDRKLTEYGQSPSAIGSSPFNHLFDEAMSLREVANRVLKLVKLKPETGKTIKTVIKGVLEPSSKSGSSFEVAIKDSQIRQIGLKRKKVNNNAHQAAPPVSGAPVVSWTSRPVNGMMPNLYQTVKAAVLDGAFSTPPFQIRIEGRHWRYPVYQRKQSFNIMLVLDVSNSVRWVLKFMEQIIGMLTAQANACKDKLGLIIFNDDRAHVMHYPTSNIRHVIGTINTLSPKGKTPLADGMRLAFQTLEQSRFRVTGMSNAIVLLSDCFPEPIVGGYEDQLDEPVCQQILALCDKISEAAIKLLVISPAIKGLPDYEKHIGYRLGKLAAERAKGNFLSLMAEPTGSVFSDQESYRIPEASVKELMREIGGFRMDQ